jgi:hypothetical protein
VLDNAVRICGAKFGTLYLFDDEVFELSHFPTPLAGFRAAQDAINIGWFRTRSRPCPMDKLWVHKLTELGGVPPAGIFKFVKTESVQKKQGFVARLYPEIRQLGRADRRLLDVSMLPKVSTGCRKRSCSDKKRPRWRFKEKVIPL